MSPVAAPIILSERDGPGWAETLSGIGFRPAVFMRIGDVLRAISLRPPAVIGVELPVSDASPKDTIALFCGHPQCQASRLVFVGDPGCEPATLGAHPDVHVVPERAGLEPARLRSLFAVSCGSDDGALAAANQESATHLCPIPKSWSFDESRQILAGARKKDRQGQAIALVVICGALAHLSPTCETPRTLGLIAPAAKTLVKDLSRSLWKAPVWKERPQMLLVQRLLLAWVQAIDAAYPYAGSTPDVQKRHRFAVACMAHKIGALRSLLLLEALCGALTIQGTWLALHDAHMILDLRLAPLCEEGAEDVRAALARAAGEYLEALVAGCAKEKCRAGLLGQTPIANIRAWAAQAQLRYAVPENTRYGLWLVNMTEDRPPTFFLKSPAEERMRRAIALPDEALAILCPKPLGTLGLASS